VGASVGSLDRVKRFLRDVRVEVRKVAWPNKDELTTYTLIVVLTVIAMSVFVGVSDLIVSQILRLLWLLGG